MNFHLNQIFAAHNIFVPSHVGANILTAARKPLSNLGAQIGGGQIDYGAEFEHFGSKNVAMGRSFCWG